MAKAKKPVAKKKSPAKAKAKSAAPKKSASVKAKPKAQTVKAGKAKAKPVAAKATAKKSASTKAAPQKAAKSQGKPAAKAASKSTNAKSSSSNPKLVDVSQFVTPLDDRLIVQLKSAERMTAGGLIIPDTVTDVSGHLEGTVLSVGRGHRDPKGRVRPMDVKRGDKIVFSSFAGAKLEYQNADLMILRETDVMGVIG